MTKAERTLPLIDPHTTSSGHDAAIAQAITDLYPDWPLIEIFGVGPDGKTCHCKEGANCKSAGKHPKLFDWQKSDRVEKVRKGSNLGVQTGEPAGFWVLDIDEAGKDAMAGLIREHGTLPNTRVHQTGGGTWHYFFTMPDFPVTNRRGSLPKGIDVRGTGGQVVLPPSKSGKGPYRVIRDNEILPAPLWLLDMIRPKEPIGTFHGIPVVVDEAVPASMDGIVANFDDFFAEEDAAVERLAAEAIPHAQHVQTARERSYEESIVKGEIARLDNMRLKATPGGDGYEGDPWDQTTYMVSCQLVELANASWSALTVEEARIIVAEHAPTDAGFTAEHVAAKFDSAVRSVGEKQRPAPVDNTSWLDDVPTSNPVAAKVAERKEKTTRDPADFFNRDGLDSSLLGAAVVEEGPIRWGQNNRWWTYDEQRGVWREERYAVRWRAIDLLGSRYRTSHSELAEQVVRRHAEELVMDEPDARWMNFANGMLDWRTGDLVPHDPDYLSITQFPHRYQPGATCPRFESFLDSVMSPDYQHLAWEMIAYLLYSGNPLQVAFLLHGEGGDGKGTLLKVVQAMLGKENLSFRSLDSLNSDKFAPADLFGKISNIAGDIDGTFQESTARFKMLTGEDVFPGEHKFGDSFGFKCWAVPVFSANKIPGSTDVSRGYLRRWINLEFDRKFSGDPIPALGESLAATEVPGVIAKALTFLPALLARGSFLVQGEAEKGKEEFAKSIDQVRQWVEEECMDDPEGRVEAASLYRDYRFWAERNGVGRLKSADFYARLAGAGYRPVKVKGTRYHKGLALMQRTGPDYLGEPKPADDLDSFFGKEAS